MSWTLLERLRKTKPPVFVPIVINENTVGVHRPHSVPYPGGWSFTVEEIKAAVCENASFADMLSIGPRTGQVTVTQCDPTVDQAAERLVLKRRLYESDAELLSRIEYVSVPPAGGRK